MEESIVNPEAAIPTEEQGATAPAEEANNASDTESATQQGEPETAISEGAPGGESAEAEPSFGLEVKYNKTNRTLSRDEAKDYAEQGMFYADSIKPLYNKLDYIAAQRGQSIEEVVDRLMNSDEEHHRQELIERFGEESDVIDDLMRVYRDGQKQKYDKIVADRQRAAEAAEARERESLEARLASEFAELRGEFPEFKEFKELPKAVKAEAAKGRDLLSAYLRYRHSEGKRTADALVSAEAAAKATTGTGKTDEPATDSIDDAFIKGALR